MTQTTLRHGLAGLVLTAALLCGCGPRPLMAQARPEIDPAQAKRIEALRNAGPKAPLIIFPVQVQGKPSRNVADALGLVLESCGMTNHDTVDAGFAPPTDAAWTQMPGLFAAFLKECPAKGEYNLYAQYLGEPRSGPTEVRFIVADAAGNVVLTDVQTPRDVAFKRTALRDPDPMGCSVLVADRLFSEAGWKQSERHGDPNGKFARLWAEKSGTPAEAEQAAMEKRAKKLKAALKNARIAVYATRVGDAPDAKSAARLAQAVTARLGCKAEAVESLLEIKLKPSSNEQKRLWDMARAFREQLRAHPPQTEYALLGEYYVDAKHGIVGAVHLVLCDKSGNWVIVDFQNNQHEDFQRVMPKSVEDCDRLAVERIAQRVK